MINLLDALSPIFSQIFQTCFNPFEPRTNIGSTPFRPRALLAILQPTLLKLFFSKFDYINEFEVVFCLSEVGRLENDIL